MSHLAGTGGSVDTGSVVAGIKSWTLDRPVEMLDTTDFGSSGDKEYISGLKGWSGSFEGNKDGVPQTLAGAIVTLKLYESAAIFWTGSALLNNLTVNTGVDGLVNYGYTYQGTGALTTASA